MVIESGEIAFCLFGLGFRSFFSERPTQSMFYDLIVSILVILNQVAICIDIKECLVIFFVVIISIASIFLILNFFIYRSFPPHPRLRQVFFHLKLFFIHYFYMTRTYFQIRFYVQAFNYVLSFIKTLPQLQKSNGHHVVIQFEVSEQYNQWII